MTRQESLLGRDDARHAALVERQEPFRVDRNSRTAIVGYVHKPRIRAARSTTGVLRTPAADSFAATGQLPRSNHAASASGMNRVREA